MLGVTAISGMRIGAMMLMRQSTANYVIGIAEALFVIYAVTVLWIWQDFRLAILGYFPSLLVPLWRFPVRNRF